VTAIRTAVVTMSPLLRDIVKELPTGRVRLQIVADLTTRDLLLDRLKTILPDVVLIGLARGETDRIARSILAALPRSRVIAFSSAGRQVYIHEMRPHRTALSDASASAVIRALWSPQRARRV
jgi:chemotaxis response regulator CheB